MRVSHLAEIPEASSRGQWSVASSRGRRPDICRKQLSVSGFRFPLFVCSFALLYAPTRLIEEANPGWRLVSWALAIEVVGLTLIFICLALGASALRFGRAEPDATLADQIGRGAGGEGLG